MVRGAESTGGGCAAVARFGLPGCQRTPDLAQQNQALRGSSARKAPQICGSEPNCRLASRAWIATTAPSSSTAPLRSQQLWSGRSRRDRRLTHCGDEALATVTDRHALEAWTRVPPSSGPRVARDRLGVSEDRAVAGACDQRRDKWAGGYSASSGSGPHAPVLAVNLRFQGFVPGLASNGSCTTFENDHVSPYGTTVLPRIGPGLLCAPPLRPERWEEA